MMDWQRRKLTWLQNLSLDDGDIIVKSTHHGWRARISEGDFTLYGAYADDATDAISTLYRSRELSIIAIERDLAIRDD